MIPFVLCKINFIKEALKEKKMGGGKRPWNGWNGMSKQV